MKFVYLAYLPILTITYALFVQRAIYWADKWRKGAKKLRLTDRYSRMYTRTYKLLMDAKIQTVAWIVLSFTVLYAYMDCIQNLKERW